VKARLSPVEAEAAKWLARRDRGFTAEEKEAFQRWCSEPVHAEAVGQLSRLWAAFDQPAMLGKERLLEGKLALLSRASRRRRMAAFGTASAAVAGLVLALWIGPSVWHRAEASASVQGFSRVVQPDRRILNDGTVIDLKPGSRIAVDYSAPLRRVTLLRGVALFQVAKDPRRPFVVEVSGIEVRAVGTAFSIDLDSAQVEVLVTEGRVAVNRAAGAPTAAASEPALDYVAAGTRLVITRSESKPPEFADLSQSRIADLLSWTVPRLEFTDVSLAEAAALFNQKSSGKIFVDSSVAPLRVTGVFRSDNAEGFVHAVESSLGIEAEHRADGSILLRRAD